jgi:Domain of unknown function (DUF5667)
MTSVFQRRRAERFAELVDQASSMGGAVGSEKARHGPRHRVRSRPDDDLSTLVILSQRTATLELAPAAAPDPGFRADLRAMLVATAEREGIGATADASATLLARRPLSIGGAGARVRVAVILGIALGVLALTGISTASAGAMPGDTLYGVKRSTERAELAFAGSDLGRGQLYLDFARTRLAEAKAVGGAARFAGVLADMDSDTRQGVRLLTTAAVDQQDPNALDAVAAFVADQQSGAGELLDKVAGASRTRLLGSLDLLERVADRAHRLRETLTCGIDASDGSDALGPRPGRCSPGSDGAGSADAGHPARSTPDPVAPTAAHGPRAGTTIRPAAPGAPRSTPTAVLPLGGGTATGQPAQSRPTPAPSPSAHGGGDGGLLDGVNRIVGGLLGG